MKWAKVCHVAKLGSNQITDCAIACRVEYAKAHARARRYAEEEELVVEEMRRTLKYFEWKSNWWLSLDSTHRSRIFESGQKAYAAKQATMVTDLARKFERLWRPLLKDLDMHEYSTK